MKTLFETIRDRRAAITQTEFIQFLSDKSADTEARIAYVPDMLFFIMGFKDILHGLKVEDTTDELQLEVNEHCDEDNGHWKWFLYDIDRIKLRNNYLEQSNYRMFSELWSDENFIIRDMVYQTIHYGKATDSPAIKMIILEVIEAVFSVFVESMLVLVHQLGKWEDYKFFGRIHYEAENGHASGSWLDGGKTELKSEKHLSPAEKQYAHAVVNGMFGKFEEMFARWYEKQQQYLQVVA